MHQPFDFNEALFLSPTGVDLGKTLNLSWAMDLPMVRHDFNSQLRRLILLPSLRQAQQVLDSKTTPDAK